MAKIPKTKLGNQTAISGEKLDFQQAPQIFYQKTHKEMPMQFYSKIHSHSSPSFHRRNRNSYYSQNEAETGTLISYIKRPYRC
jgi:hypothetical protein